MMPSLNNYPANRLLQKVSRILARRRLFATGSYYDSQSGLHVPVHDETQIKVFLNTSDTTFIPPQLYKEDLSSDMSDKLEELRQNGIHGLIIPEALMPRDHRNLNTLLNISPPGFQLFSFFIPEPLDTTASVKEEKLNVILPYTSNDNNDKELETSLQSLVSSGLKTTIVLGDDCYSDGVEPVLIANKIASFIDAHGGGDYLWVAKNDTTPIQDADNVVRLCEELAYLDLRGSTVKSRLMVDVSLDEEVMDETMMMGVNKFVVDNEDQVDIVREIAEEQGKKLLLSES